MADAYRRAHPFLMVWSAVLWQYDSCMRKSFKYRLYPNRSQAEVLDMMLEIHRRLYNLLRERRDVYEAEGRSVSYGEQSGRFKHTRRALRSFAATNFSSGQATLRRLDSHGRVPFPRRRLPAQRRRTDFAEALPPAHRARQGQAAPPGRGEDQDRFRQEGLRQVVRDLLVRPRGRARGDGAAVGIDLGSKSFLVTSEGDSVEPPRYYRKAQKKLRRAQRSLLRKQRGSNRRRKARERVARLHERTANQRRDFHHKQARKLVDSHGLFSAKPSTSRASPEPGSRSPRTTRVGRSSSTSLSRKRKRLLFG